MRIPRPLKYFCFVASALAIAVGGLGLARNFADPILSTTNFSQRVLDRDGELLRISLSGDEKYRFEVGLEDVNSQFVKALLAYEDRYFFYHPGFNVAALMRAIYSTYYKGEQMGGSTLTMQVVRLRYGLRTRSIFGKLIQILKAVKMEALHSKREILEAYLNLAPYGSNIEGLGAASWIYYGKVPKDLSMSEIQTLVTIPQSPLARSEFQKKVSPPFLAPHFVQYVLDHHPKASVLKTTLHLKTQSQWENRIEQYLHAQSEKGVKNAAAILLNYETMQVEAWVGSANFFNDEIQGQVNGVLARRSPGSTLKPFVYGLALDQGLIHPLTLLKDSPSSFGAFDPENFDRQFLGPVTATDALVQSRNVPAVYLASHLKDPSLYTFLKGAGIDLPRSENYYGLSIALGGAEVSLLDLAELYAMLARHGVRSPSHVLLKNENLKRESHILSPEASFVVLDMLTHNPLPNQNYPREWVRGSYPVAWKTGTSRSFRDAWAMAVVGPYVAGVWLGNFDNESNPAFVGRELAAPLLFELIGTLNRDSQLEAPPFLSRRGLNVKKVHVCSVSGHLPGAHCPTQTETWFIPGRSPISVCDIHREILISSSTGLRVCQNAGVLGSAIVPRVFEFWPTDLLQLFHRAGISRRVPPTFEARCALNERGNNGVAPEIVSPKDQVFYEASLSASDDLNVIPMRAVADADVQQVYWYLGSQFVGASSPDKPLLWRAEPGDYTLRVVDNHGRSDVRALRVRAVR